MLPRFQLRAPVLQRTRSPTAKRSGEERGVEFHRRAVPRPQLSTTRGKKDSQLSSRACRRVSAPRF